MPLLRYETKDYYKVLQVPENTTQEEIKQSFYHLAKQFHPDVNKASDATERFEEINEAYQVLGNSAERSLYDQVRKSKKVSSDFFTRTSSAPDADATTTNPAYQQETDRIHAYRRKLIIAAISKVFFTTLAAVLVGYAYIVLIELLAWAMVGLRGTSLQAGFQTLMNPATLQGLLWNFHTLGGTLAGLVIGIILGLDLNFKIETFITNTRMRKTYHLLRTLLFTFAFAFLFVMLTVLLDNILRTEILWLKIGMLVLGLLLGSTISSDGNFIVRVKTAAGWRELFFIFMRNLGFGILGGLLGALLGWILSVMFPEAQQSIFLYMPLTGFALLTALGSTSEEEISNMIREIDEVTKKTIFITLILLMLVIGLIAGFFMRPYFPV